jgi:hypothetical protein
MEFLIERYLTEPNLENFTEWLVDYGRYNKWNLNCCCGNCRGQKRRSENNKRRVALKAAGIDWEQDLENPTEYR